MNSSETPVGSEEIKKADIVDDAEELVIRLSEDQEEITPEIRKKNKDILEKWELVQDAEKLTKEHQDKLDDKVN